MRALTAVVAATILLTAGCASDGSSAGPAPAPTTTAAAPTAAPTSYDDYVALGDSYTAAPLVPPTDVNTMCLRSGANYPSLLARDLPGTRLTDVSCSGATTLNMTVSQGGDAESVPPQFDALKPDTDLVTIGLGGNDFGVFATLVGRCGLLASSDPTGSPCHDDLAVGDSDKLTDSLGEIEDNIAGVVKGVRERSPDARILVVGYPQIVPESGTCDLLPLAAGDYAYALEISAGLTNALRLGAEESGAEYVDVWTPSAGHDICSDDPWINGRVTSAERALAFHPLAVEQQAVADLIAAQLG